MRLRGCAALRTLVLSGNPVADHDHRVVQLHSQKFIAQLQHVASQLPEPHVNPLLIRVETKARTEGGRARRASGRVGG